MSKTWLKKDIEDIVEKIVDKKIEQSIKSFVTKEDVEKIIKDDIDLFYKELQRKKQVMSEKEIKDLIGKTLVNLYKFLWQKSNFFIGNI